MADINVTEEIIDINVTEEVITIEAPTGAYPFPNAVNSVFGRVGLIVAAEGDYNLTQLGDVTITSPTNNQVLKYNGTQWVNGTDTDTGLTSVGLSMPSAFSVANSPLTANGTLSVTGAGTTLEYVRGDGSLATFPSLTGFVPYTGATTNVNLGTHSLTAADLVINHVSGSGVAASITKGGNGEALTVVKSSGSGNAASITGGVTLLDELHLTTDLADAYIASAATWNAKQNAITLTTTGTSGAATLVGATLNIPQYQGVLTNPVTGTGTSGQVAYFNGTSSITSESNLFWNATNDRLGIGTSSPTSALTISGVATGAAIDWINRTSVTGRTYRWVSTDAGAFAIEDITAALLRLTISSGGNLLIGTSTDTGQRLQVSGNATISGSLGMGTTTPTAKLTISGVATGCAIDWNNTTAITGRTYRWVSLDSGGFAIEDITSGGLRMSISSAGNLLVNTTTDAGFRLDVNGTARVQGALTISNTSVGVITGGNDTNSRPMQFQNDATTGLWGGGYTFRSGYNGSAGVTMMRLFSNGTASSANAVGIGNYSEAALQNNNIKLAVFDRSTGSGATLPNYSDGISINSAAGANYNYSNTKILGLTIGEPDTGGQTAQATTATNYSVNLGFQRHPLTNGWGSSMIMSAKDDGGSMNEVMRVMGRNQSVGIGVTQTTSRAIKFQLGGSVTATSALAQGAFFNNTLVAAANNDVLVGLDINPTFTNGAFTGLTNSGIRVQGGSSNIAPSIYIKQTSNTSPTWFAVRNTDNNTGAGAISADLGISGGSNQFFNGTSQGDVVFKAYSANNTSKFFIGATSSTTAQIVLFPLTGNTGINTTTDAGFRLDVNGTARVQGAFDVQSAIGRVSVYSTNNSQNTAVQLYAKGASGTQSGAGLYYVGNEAPPARFFSISADNTNYQFNVYYNGNVSIGTNPSDGGYKLDVNGTARVQSFTTINAAPAINGESALLVQPTTNNSTSSALVFGIYNNATVNTITSTSSYTGIYSRNSVGATLVQAVAVQGDVNISAGTTSTALGFTCNSAVTGTGTASTFIGYNFTDIFKGGSGAVVRQFGIRIGNLTAGGTANVGLLFNNAANTSVNGTWDIYAQSGNNSYLAGSIGIGASTINASAKVQIDSTNSGFLPPRMTAAQRAAISSPATGLMVYQTDGTEGVYVYSGGAWKSLTMV
jgi:hypothetical protein